MEKASVMKALALCSSKTYDCCYDCPYSKRADCYDALVEDALALLKAKANDNLTYHTAIIYTKHTNLMPWLQSKYEMFGTHGTTEQAQRIREMYSKDRDVLLILLVRHEEGKCICRIKCPINPLPIKGEFQCVSTSEMTKLLASMGWKYKEKLPLGLFK